MKSRNGFVSNSSSASFVIHWKFRDFGDKIDINECLSKMYDLGSVAPDVEMMQDGQFVWENIYEDCQEHKDVVEYIKKESFRNIDGTFTTSFFTPMMNSHEDFGEAAQSFVLGLVTNDDFQIIDSKVNRDGC